MPLMDSVIHVAILDDHPIVREGLRLFLSSSRDIEVCAEGGSLDSMLPQLQHAGCDVLLLDLALTDVQDGIKAFDVITEKWPKIQIIILSSYADPRSLDYLRTHGARGYLDKTVQPDDLAATIRQVARGRQVWDDPDQSALTSLNAGLTTREQEVLDLIAQGLSNKEIAGSLGIREKTVKVHVSHVLGKLNVYDRTQAVITAHQRGLVRIGPSRQASRTDPH